MKNKFISWCQANTEEISYKVFNNLDSAIAKVRFCYEGFYIRDSEGKKVVRKKVYSLPNS